MNVTHRCIISRVICYYVYVISCLCVHNLVHISRSVMHNVCMQALCSCMNLVRIPRRDHMYLAYCICDSRRDHDMKSRSPKLMMRRSRS